MTLTFLGFDKVEWIQIIVAFGTLLAAIAAWWSSHASNKTAKIAENQLKEMEIQREEGQRPNLFVDNNNSFTLHFYPSSQLVSTADWRYIGSSSEGNEYKLNITNVGNGSALLIKAEFSFEQDFLLELCREGKKYERFSFNVGTEQGEIEFTEKIYSIIEGEKVLQESKFSNLVHIKDHYQVINYLFTQETTTIEIPNQIREMLNVAHFFLLEDDINNTKKIKPRFTLKLTYSDSHGKEMANKFVIYSSEVKQTKFAGSNYAVYFNLDGKVTNN